jgi:hypothetical protein
MPCQNVPVAKNPSKTLAQNFFKNIYYIKKRSHFSGAGAGKDSVGWW